jgi:hypothetical protein
MAPLPPDARATSVGPLGRQAGSEATPQTGCRVAPWCRGIPGRTHRAEGATLSLIPTMRVRRPRFTVRWMMAVVTACGILAAGFVLIPRHLERRRRIQALEQRRLAEATAAWDGALMLWRGGEVGPRSIYETSRLLLDCELETSASRGDRVNAIQRHLKRLRVIREDGKSQWDHITRHNIEFYFAEAELMLAREE